MKIILILAMLLGGNASHAQQISEKPAAVAAPTNSEPCQVLSYDSDRKVAELEIRARFVTGYELKPLAAVLGVSDAKIAAAKDESERELFLLLRAKSTEKARGVLTSVKLEMDIASPLINRNDLIVLPTLFEGQYFQIVKICDASDPRDPSALETVIGEEDKNAVDHVALLHKQKPKFRLRSMISK